MKNVISVIHMSQARAEILHPHDDTALISITEPGYTANLKSGWSNLLRLQFHDIDSPVRGYKQFSVHDAKLIMMFLNALPDQVEEVIIHCHAGISRSAALSYWLHNFIGIEIKNEGKFLLKNKHIVSVMENAFGKVRDEKFYVSIFGEQSE